jgi:hypothetical protein
LYMLQESKVTEILNKLIYNKYIIELSWGNYFIKQCHDVFNSKEHPRVMLREMFLFVPYSDDNLL